MTICHILLGTLAGGHVASHISRQLPQKYVRAFAILAISGITVFFFFDIFIGERVFERMERIRRKSGFAELGSPVSFL
ncbi:MAG: hypothetical protein GY792_03190 [Gammaproteobacteria bacterium]|nr:hypothetical protein [Gammaproteobacteria bacterium]